MKSYPHILSRLMDEPFYASLSRAYSEPGYSLTPDHQAILLCDWNPVPAGLQRALESHFDLEWSDEWTECSGCGGLVRVTGNSYEWRAYVWFDPDSGDCLCGDCILDDPSFYIAHLTNNPCDVDTIGLPWLDLGWVKVNTNPFENGFHEGMNDDPKAILAEARRIYPGDDFVFASFHPSQFYVEFSLYRKQHTEEAPLES